MAQERLNHLTQMSLECDIVRTMDFNDIIKDFCSAKARKKDFLTVRPKRKCKRKVHPKIKILSSFTHPHVVQTERIDFLC